MFLFEAFDEGDSSVVVFLRGLWRRVVLEIVFDLGPFLGGVFRYRPDCHEADELSSEAVGEFEIRQRLFDELESFIGSHAKPFSV